MHWQGLKSLQQRLHTALSEVPGAAASREPRASRGLSRSSASIKQDSLRKSTSLRKTTSVRKEGSVKSEASVPAAVPDLGSSQFFPQLEGMLQVLQAPQCALSHVAPSLHVLPLPVPTITKSKILSPSQSLRCA